MSRVPAVAQRLSGPAPLLATIAINATVAAAVLHGLDLPLVAALGVPLAVVALRRPQRGVLALAALVPFNGLLVFVEEPGVVAGWKELLVVSTLLATFLSAWSPEHARPAKLPGWWPAAAGLAAVALASAALIGGWQALVGLKVLFFYVLVTAAIWRCPLTPRDRDHLVTILMTTGTLVALVGLGQHVLGPDRLNQLGYQWDETLRTTGGFLRTFSTFNQPFGFGFFLVLSLIVGLPHALSQPERWRSRVFLASSPVILVALATTFVRGAWMALVVGLAYLGFTRYRVLLLAIPLGSLALLFVPQDVSSAALATASGSERIASWESELALITSQPLGVGVGSSGSAAEKVADLTTGTDTFQPDNHYYKIAFELGPLGLWMFALLLVAAFGCSRAAARRLPEPDATLAHSVAAMVLAAAVASTVATYFEIFPMDVYFWLLLGVIATCPHTSSSTA